MYNLGSALEGEDGDNTLEAVKELLEATNAYASSKNLKTFCSHTGAGKRKRSATDDDGRSGDGSGPAHDGGGTAHQLEEHGYKVVPDSFENEDGTWEALIKV